MDDAVNSVNELENKRMLEIKELGMLCYNIAADNRELPDMLRGSIAEARTLVGGADMQALDDKITEIGFVCYNLYVDKKLGQDELTAMCRSIDRISGDINLLKNMESSGTISTNLEKRNGEVYNLEDGLSLDDNSASPNPSRFPKSAFRINHPYGMEPIPEDFKKCKCGYRNKSYSKFCGKCGTPLK